MTQNVPIAGMLPPPDKEADDKAFRRQTIILNLVLWAFIYVVLSLRAPLIEQAPHDQLALRRILIVCAGALYSYCLTYPLRLAPLTAFWQRIMLGLGLAIAGALLHAFTHLMIYYRLFPVDGSKLLPNPFLASEFALWAIGWLGCYVAVVSAYLALLYSSEVRRNERSLSMMRAFADDAHLRTLRYQINPHFLFNTLNSISALILDRRTSEAEQMLQALSEFYRSTLATDPHDEIRLGDEIDIQRHYLAIEQVRFADRLEVKVDVPASLLNYRVPALLLQPIVENAIKHGVAFRAEPSVLAIAARKSGDKLVISVRNEIASAGGTNPGLGVGLANVEHRLLAHYGKSASLHAGRDGDAWLCQVVVPLRS